MSFYDEYGDMRELNPFYEAIENTLRKNGVAPASEILEKGNHSFPRLPSEFVENEDYPEIIPDGDLPF